MVTIAAQKKSKILPIVVVALIVLVVLGLGYYVFTTLRSNNETPTTGTALDTTQLGASGLKYVQYLPATAPEPSTTDVGRQDPFAPY